MKRSLTFITRSAVIAAAYFALSVAFEAISFGPIQFRISEALTLLPVLLPEAIPGLAIGCFFTNLFFSPFGFYDMLFGTLATLLGAILTRVLRKWLPLSALPPILLNALLVPLIWICDGSDTVYYINMFSIMASEFIICGVIGVPFTMLLKNALLSARLIKSDVPLKNYRHIPPYKREAWLPFVNDDDSEN